MTIAIAGAGGKLGRLTVMGLKDAIAEGRGDERLIALGREPNRLADLAARGVEVRHADYTEPDSLPAALAGVDTLLLISSNAKTGRPVQHAAVVDAARVAGVGRLVYTSVLAAATSTLVLAPDHKASEEHLLASGLESTILRNGWYTENFVRQLNDARETGVVPAAVGDGRVASAARADFAAAAVEALLGEGHAGKIYELSGDTAWDHDELAATLAEVLGKPVRYERMDGPALIADQLAKGISPARAEFVARMDADIADGALALVTHDLSRLIGRPTTPLKVSLEAMAAAALPTPR